MTNNIYPPDHLLRKWESLVIDEEQNVDVVLYEAFQAGADHELEACCEWLAANDWKAVHKHLRTARRPKPPSHKELALIALTALEACAAQSSDTTESVFYIRRALESLPD
jgi:hypothetical protein